MTLIFLDFSARDVEGRLYAAPLNRFSPELNLGDRFMGTDFDEFTVECEVLAIDRVRDRVYHRPVRPHEVPGSYDFGDCKSYDGDAQGVAASETHKTTFDSCEWWRGLS